jgi:hypothetical protein
MQYGTHNRLTVKQALPGLLVACRGSGGGSRASCLMPPASALLPLGHSADRDYIGCGLSGVWGGVG